MALITGFINTTTLDLLNPLFLKGVTLLKLLHMNINSKNLMKSMEDGKQAWIILQR